MKYAMTKEKNHKPGTGVKAKKQDLPISDELVVKRKGGGSVINHRPLFSDDSGSIFIIWEKSIREYNTKTGQLLKSFENPRRNLVDYLTDIGVNPEEKSLIYACSNNGKLLAWDKETGFIQTIATFTHNIGRNKVAGFHFSKYKNFLYIIVNLETNGRLGLYRVRVQENKKKETCEMLPFKCKDGQHTYSFGGESHQEFVASIKKNVLNILELKTRNRIGQRINSERPFTCVASHKTEMCIATGDASGRILIWRDFLVKKHAPYSVYHWHTLPVADVAFSQAASHFYSGAAECVLVKWVMDTDSRMCLPRIGAPIVHVTVSPDNRYAAVSTEENAIHLVDPSTKIVQTIQHMSLSLPSGTDHHMFKAGLVLDPSSKALIINSTAGHLQFYSVENRDLMFKLDIVGQNFITKERNSELINTDITRVAITEDGKWLATVEERDDKETHREVRLKFWKAHWLESFKLNTSVELPHQGEVMSVQFQPGTSGEDEPPRAVTTGTDKRFCTWTLIDALSEKDVDEDTSWACEGIGTHQNLQAGPAVFSSDGSLMAVAFEHAVTLWLPGTTELQSSLTHPETKENIKHLQFGNLECCHLLVAASENRLCVWDLLTLTLTWTVPIHITCMAANPRNTHIAAFTKYQLLIFTPSQKQPLFRHDVPRDCEAVAATFYPYFGRKSQCIEWQQLAQLYFINKDQELLCFEKNADDEDVSEEVVDTLPPSGQYHQTAFSALLAKQATSLVKEARPPPIWEQQLKSSEGSYTQMLCNTPAHMLPPMELIARDLIQECLEVQCVDTRDTTSTPTNGDEEMDEDLSAESDSEVEEAELKPEEESEVKVEKVDEDVVAREEKSRALETIMQEDMAWVPNLMTL